MGGDAPGREVFGFDFGKVYYMHGFLESDSGDLPATYGARQN